MGLNQLLVICFNAPILMILYTAAIGLFLELAQVLLYPKCMHYILILIVKVGWQ